MKILLTIIIICYLLLITIYLIYKGGLPIKKFGKEGPKGNKGDKGNIGERGIDGISEFGALNFGLNFNNGEGFAVLDTTDIEISLVWSLSFHIKINTNGYVMSYGDPGNESGECTLETPCMPYFVCFVDKGKFTFIYKGILNEGEVNLTNDKIIITDNEWHTIHINRNENEWSLYIDEDLPIIEIAELMEFFLFTDWFFGDSPFIRINPNLNSGISGCIKTVVIDGKERQNFLAYGAATLICN